MVKFEKIDDHNFYECIALSVSDEQKNFVASNLYSIAQAYTHLTNELCIPMPYAIYHDATMVGFIMLSYDPVLEGEKIYEEPVYAIWRLMIDKKYQGRGYGRQAMVKAIELIRKFLHGETKKAVLSYEPHNSVARKLYASLGFVETGEMDGDEVIVILDLT